MTTNQFSGPRAKLRAVRRNGNLFKAEIAKYVDSTKDCMRFVTKPPSNWMSVFADMPPLPDDLSVILGETAYHLRSALDLLACDLARWSGESDVSGVYFPIAKTKEGYGEKGTQKKIAKLKPELRSMVDAIQPYGGSTLVELNAIANADKHQALLAVIPSIQDTNLGIFGSGEFEKLEFKFRRPSQTETGSVELLRIPHSAKVDGIHLKLHCRIVFAVEPIAGKPVTQRIGLMASAVEGVIKKFEDHCFGIAP